jgi:hypothetical protein
MLDGCKQFARYYIKEKIENKGSQIGHTKTILKQKNTFKVLVSVFSISLKGSLI